MQHRDVEMLQRLRHGALIVTKERSEMVWSVHGATVRMLQTRGSRDPGRRRGVRFWQAVAVAEHRRLANLLDDDELVASSMIANCAMNRERQLTGVNSYARELGFDPVELLTAALASTRRSGASVAWLDPCCGTGRALIQAADRLAGAGLAGRAELVGVDLVDAFDPAPAQPASDCSTPP
jgi:hypothetical protein